MTQARHITILTKEASLGSGIADSALLIELAPDSPWLLSQKNRPENLIELICGRGDLPAAYALARQLIEAQPEWEGVKILEVFEEIITEELLATVRDLRLHQWLRSAGVTSCDLNQFSDFGGRLGVIQQLTGNSYQLGNKVSEHELSRKLARTLRSHGRGVAGLLEVTLRATRRVFPQWSRYVPANLRGRSSPGPDKTWFYTTSYNDTSIGLLYEPDSGHEFHYLFEDPGTGGSRLRAAGRTGASLYSFLRMRDILSLREIERAKRSVTDSAASVHVPPEHELTYNVFLRSDRFRYILDRLLPIAMVQIRASRRFLEEMNPELLVVGNAAWERVLLLQANSRRVPTILLQHGLVHHTLAVADQPVGSFLVRGEFFRQQLCPALRQKSTVLNCASDRIPSPERKSDGSIIYLTAPYHQLTGYHPVDLEDILRALLVSAVETKRPLVIRVHPLDSVFHYRELVKRLLEQTNLRPEVLYSQGPGLEEALRNSSVAVLHFSTVFLDCIRLGIPIVSFDWHSFPFKEQYKDQGIFQFAGDLANLKRLVALGTSGSLPVKAEIGHFLRPTSSREINNFFSGQSAKRSAC
ncbi:MAG: hypothetical protein ACM3JB_15445 [Acidobacteriaceae bacterium]